MVTEDLLTSSTRGSRPPASPAAAVAFVGDVAYLVTASVGAVAYLVKASVGAVAYPVTTSVIAFPFLLLLLVVVVIPFYR